MRQIFRRGIVIFGLLCLLAGIIGGVSAQVVSTDPLAVFVFNEPGVASIVRVNPRTGDSDRHDYTDFGVLDAALPALGCHLPVMSRDRHLGFLDVRTLEIHSDIPIKWKYFQLNGMYSPDEHYRWMMIRDDDRAFGLRRLIINLDTGAVIERDADRYSFMADWSPDSHHLVEYKVQGGGGNLTTSLATDLVNPDTGATIPLPVAVLRGENVWSPDSQHLLLRNTQEEIEVIDLNGQTQHRLAQFNQIRWMSWLDNQTVVVLARNGRNADETTTPLRLVAWSLTDDTVRDIGLPINPTERASISPDGKYAYYASRIPQTIVNTQTGAVVSDVPVSETHIRHFGWSGDSRYLMIGDSSGISIHETSTGEMLTGAFNIGFSLTPLDLNGSGYVYFENSVDRERLGLIRFTDEGVVHTVVKETGASSGVWCFPETGA